jgi:hypothetical protein
MVPITTPFAEALETLFRNRVSGLALVDHEFKLSGNLSASDLRVCILLIVFGVVLFVYLWFASLKRE